MKLLTATMQTQGQRDSDFAWCIEGELVTPIVLICDIDRDTGPDGGCGCGRSFTGLNSHKNTTTALVKDIDGYTLEDLAEAVDSYRQQAGWEHTDDLTAGQHAAYIAETAAEYDDGDVVEIRMGQVSRR